MTDQSKTTARYRHREATADECPGKTREEYVAEWSCAHPGATVAGAEKTFDAYVRHGIMIEVQNV